MTFAREMKHAFLVFVFLIVVAVEGNAQSEGILQRNSVSKVLDEGYGTKVILSVRPDNPAMHVIRDYCTVTIYYSDGAEKQLSTFRPYRNNFVAQIDPRKNGNVALVVQGDLLIDAKEMAKSTRIAILRSNLIDRKLEVDGFYISDIVWHVDQLVCLGVFRPKNSDSRSCDFPFVSKMSVNDSGEPRNHQIIWTTWHPEATPRRIPDAWIHSAAKPLASSSMLDGDFLIWRNQGHWRAREFPEGNHSYLQNSSWLKTNIESGKTERLHDPLEADLRVSIRRHGNFILGQLEHELISPGNPDNRERLEYLIRAFLDEGHTGNEQDSEQVSGGNGE